MSVLLIALVLFPVLFSRGDSPDGEVRDRSGIVAGVKAAAVLALAVALVLVPRCCAIMPRDTARAFLRTCGGTWNSACAVPRRDRHLLRAVNRQPCRLPPR